MINMLKSLHHAGVKLEMMLPYKIVNNNKRDVHLMSVQYSGVPRGGRWVRSAPGGT